MFQSSNDLFKALRDDIQSKKDVSFQGCFWTAMDPFVSHKERVKMMIQEVWKVTGFRFTYVTSHDRHNSGLTDL
jgi:hypothetical protein